MNKHNDDKQNSTQNDRIIELEIHVAQLEVTATELSDIVNQQWQMIDKLNHNIKSLKNFIKEATGQNNADLENEPEVPPPHY